MKEITRPINRKQFEYLIRYYPNYSTLKGMVFNIAENEFLRSNGETLSYIKYHIKSEPGCIQRILETEKLQISDFPSKLDYLSIEYERRFIVTKKGYIIILRETSGVNQTDTVNYSLSFRGENPPWETVFAKIDSL